MTHSTGALERTGRTTPRPTSTNPVVEEHHRIEQLVASLRIGETAVVNGTPVTAVSLADALALSRAEAMSAADRLAHDFASYVRPKAGA